MNLIEQSPARIAASEIQQILDEIRDYNSFQLTRIYGLVNTPGLEQSILDKFGSNGVAALQAYVAFRQAMETIAPGTVPEANTDVFQPQQDGTIVFVAPTAPEVE